MAALGFAGESIVSEPTARIVWLVSWLAVPGSGPWSAGSAGRDVVSVARNV